jgi:RHS repeat-associated protein
MYVVNELTTPDGSGGNGACNTIYFYKDAIYSPRGLGFLGFLNLTSWNTLSSYITSTNYTLSQFNNLVPSTSTTSTPYPYSAPFSDESYTYSPVSLGGLRYFLPLTQHIHNNDIAGTSTVTNYTYYSTSEPSSVYPDNYGNISDQNTQISVISSSDLVQTIDVQETYTSSGAWVPSAVGTCTTTVTLGANSPYIRTVDYTWDNSGHLTSSIKDPSTIVEVTTACTYDSHAGALLNQTTSSSDVNCLSTSSSYTYDPYSQFLTSNTNPLGQVTNYVYDPRWGTPTQVTTPDGLSTYNLYDVWGKKIQTVTPDYLQQNITYNWTSSADFPLGTSPPFDIGPAGLNTALYKINSQKSGSPSATVYYDWIDRAIGSASDGFNSTTYSVKSYTPLGQVYQSSMPYQNAGLSPVTSTNSYDVFNRPIEIDVTANSEPTLTTTYSYTPNTGSGTMTTTITKPDGKSSSQTTDPTGALINSTDYENNSNTVYSSLDYIYLSNGQVSEVDLNSGAIITTQYDNFGRKTQYNDINYVNGYSYTYNAYNQLLSQTDPNGNVYNNFKYDKLGRLTQKFSILENGYYTYNYFSNSSHINLLAYEIAPNGNTVTYTYDNLRRPTAINENGLTTTFQYDAYSNVINVTYPGGFGITNQYNSAGYLTQTNRADNGALIWQANAMNAFGQYYQYTLGNGVQTVKTYTNYDELQSITAGSNENIAYSFNPENGNLTSRVENGNLTESFFYDAAILNNRLSEAQSYSPCSSVANETSGNKQADITMNYDLDGNILNKSDICASSTNYTNASSNNQVTEVPNSNHLITPGQSVTYTSFNAPSNISLGIYSLAFTYGPNNNREETILTDGSGNTTTRYYSQDYEKTLLNNSLQYEINYINCGGDLVGMYVNQPSGGALYYVYTDHIGSILTVTDGNSNTYNQSFDAWGNYRNSDGTYSGNPPSGNPSWLYRGFTGHEHLAQMQLINANGRLYDPLINSMLSADNNINDPANTQSYNRYSYCLNNPLKYSDPSGFTVTDGNGNADFYPGGPIVWGPTSGDWDYIPASEDDGGGGGGGGNGLGGGAGGDGSYGGGGAGWGYVQNQIDITEANQYLANMNLYNQMQANLYTNNNPSSSSSQPDIFGNSAATAFNNQMISDILGSDIVNAASQQINSFPDISDVMATAPTPILAYGYQFIGYNFSDAPGAMGFGGPEQGMSCSGLLCRLAGYTSQVWATCLGTPPGFTNITNTLNTSSDAAFYSGLMPGDVMVFSQCNNPQNQLDHTVFFSGYYDGLPIGFASWTSIGVNYQSIDWLWNAGNQPQAYRQTNIINYWNNFWNTYGKW